MEVANDGTMYHSLKNDMLKMYSYYSMVQFLREHFIVSQHLLSDLLCSEIYSALNAQDARPP